MGEYPGYVGYLLVLFHAGFICRDMTLPAILFIVFEAILRATWGYTPLPEYHVNVYYPLVGLVAMAAGHVFAWAIGFVGVVQRLVEPTKDHVMYESRHYQIVRYTKLAIHLGLLIAGAVCYHFIPHWMWFGGALTLLFAIAADVWLYFMMGHQNVNDPHRRRYDFSTDRAFCTYGENSHRCRRAFVLGVTIVYDVVTIGVLIPLATATSIWTFWFALGIALATLGAGLITSGVMYALG